MSDSLSPFVQEMKQRLSRLLADSASAFEAYSFIVNCEEENLQQQALEFTHTHPEADVDALWEFFDAQRPR